MYVEHQSMLDYPSKDGTLRSHLEESARRGNVESEKELDGAVAYPDAVAYLHRWSLELYGRSGMSSAGMAPLGYGTIADWSRLTDQHPEPHEVDALLRLDAAMRHTPAIEEKKPEREVVVEPKPSRWPKPKD